MKVREGRLVVAECVECGCRLDDNEKHFVSGEMFFYDTAELVEQVSAGLLLRDAKGCICSLYTEEVFLEV